MTNKGNRNSLATADSGWQRGERISRPHPHPPPPFLADIICEHSLKRKKKTQSSIFYTSNKKFKQYTYNSGIQTCILTNIGEVSLARVCACRMRSRLVSINLYGGGGRFFHLLDYVVGCQFIFFYNTEPFSLATNGIINWKSISAGYLNG